MCVCAVNAIPMLWHGSRSSRITSTHLIIQYYENKYVSSIIVFYVICDVVRFKIVIFPGSIFHGGWNSYLSVFSAVCSRHDLSTAAPRKCSLKAYSSMIYTHRWNVVEIDCHLARAVILRHLSTGCTMKTKKNDGLSSANKRSAFWQFDVLI